MLSIAVCDDQLLECCSISAKIRTMMEELRIPCTIRQFGSGRELVQAAGEFDLIVLDILMEGMDGMETARLCRSHGFDGLLVFLSSSRSYVFDAYDVEAFHYLVKPVDDEKLKRVLKRAAKKRQTSPRDYILVNLERQKKKIFLDRVR